MEPLVCVCGGAFNRNFPSCPGRTALGSGPELGAWRDTWDR